MGCFICLFVRVFVFFIVLFNSAVLVFHNVVSTIVMAGLDFYTLSHPGRPISEFLHRLSEEAVTGSACVPSNYFHALIDHISNSLQTEIHIHLYCPRTSHHPSHILRPYCRTFHPLSIPYKCQCQDQSIFTCGAVLTLLICDSGARLVVVYSYIVPSEQQITAQKFHKKEKEKQNSYCQSYKANAREV